MSLQQNNLCNFSDLQFCHLFNIQNDLLGIAKRVKNKIGAVLITCLVTMATCLPDTAYERKVLFWFTVAVHHRSGVMVVGKWGFCIPLLSGSESRKLRPEVEIGVTFKGCRSSLLLLARPYFSGVHTSQNRILKWCKPDNLSLIPGTIWWKERTDPHVLSWCINTHKVCLSLCIQ